MNVKIKRIHPNAVIPVYAKYGDAGLDLVAVSSKELHAFGEYDNANSINEGVPIYKEYSTGISIEIPEGFVGLLFPRSSISTSALMLANSVGVIDSGYRGEIKVRFKVLDKNNYTYDVGDRVAQLIILPYPKINLIEAEELSSTERGEGGHGHTGK